MSSSEVNIVEDVLSSLKINFKLKTLQKDCLKHIMNGRDVFAVLPTGYGKTVIYTVLPMLLWQINDVNRDLSSPSTRLSSVIIVISPLISLMKDQQLNMESYGVEAIHIGEKHDEGRYILIFLLYIKYKLIACNNT